MSSTYLPAHFEETDLPTLQALVDAHPLATWATLQAGALAVHHVPFLLDRTRGPFGTLVGHVARANPVWRDPQPGVFVFQGAQAYISPGWYATKKEHGKVVPTWNYAVVHAQGTPVVVDEAQALLAIVSRLTDRHEAAQQHPWQVGDAPADFVEKLLEHIVGIEVPVQRLVGKWKVSQNRSESDRQGVAQGLALQEAAHPMVDLLQGHARR